MHHEWTKDALSISTDPAKIDAGAVHAYLTRSYWTPGIPLEVVKRSLANSLCFGLFDAGRQVGFARVVTDYATFGYLADVYVLESHRGRGLAKWMIGCVMAHPELQGLRRFNLVTRDAHALYQPFGFVPPAQPENYMELVKRDIYKTGRSGGESANGLV